MREDEKQRCVLCGKEKEGGRKIIVGLHGAICSDCVVLCNDIILPTEGGASSWKPPTDTSVLALLIRLTRQLAGKRFVILGEGNTSARDGESSDSQLSQRSRSSNQRTRRG